MSNIIPLDLINETRKQLLQQTDKYLIQDYPITSNNLNEIIEYRQSLRNLLNNLPSIPPYLPIIPSFASSNILMSSIMI